MRRFDYTAYFTPDDPKLRRQQTTGKFRTDAATVLEVARAIAGGEIESIDIPVDSGGADDHAENRFAFSYRSLDPHPCQVFVEMHEVAEDPTHPLTREGFVAWAEAQVAKNPVVDGSPNTVELELAAVLHNAMAEQLYGEKASELRAWLSDILMVGHKGFAEMTRDELLQEIEDEVIQGIDESDANVEDVVE